jgi:hypothetical protein
MESNHKKKIFWSGQHCAMNCPLENRKGGFIVRSTIGGSLPPERMTFGESVAEFGDRDGLLRKLTNWTNSLCHVADDFDDTPKRFESSRTSMKSIRMIEEEAGDRATTLTLLVPGK